jgi:hypothetical protein
MPNWTSNNVLFVGKENQLKKLQTMLKSDDNEFDFNNVIPMPNELSDTVSGSENAKPEWQKKRSQELISKYGADNWYSWSIENWGTKWNAIDTEVEQRDGTLIYRFNTAWDAPRNIAEALLRMQKTILQDINISWECIHEDGDEEETIIDIETEYDIKAS